VKLDFLGHCEPALREEVARIKARGLKIVAEKLESDEHYDLALELGCDHFQGFFFARPRLMAGTRLQGNKLAILRLLSALDEALARALSYEQGDWLSVRFAQLSPPGLCPAVCHPAAVPPQRRCRGGFPRPP
jgi:hypothetical protein